MKYIFIVAIFFLGNAGALQSQIHPIFLDHDGPEYRGHINDAIFEYIFLTNKTRQWEGNGLARSDIYPSLFDSTISLKYQIPMEVKPDPYRPGFHVVDVIDWVVCYQGDTVAIPLPDHFRKEEKRYLHFLDPARPSLGRRLISGQAIFYKFPNHLHNAPVLEKLSLRLAMFGVNNTVYPRSAYYHGYSRMPYDSIFWQFIESRHCEGVEDCANSFYIMKTPRSNKIVQVKNTKGENRDLTTIDLISFDLKSIEDDTPLDKSKWESIGAPPPPIVKRYELQITEIVRPLVSYPRSYEDIRERRTVYSKEDLIPFKEKNTSGLFGEFFER